MSDVTLIITAAILYAGRTARHWPETASHREMCMTAALNDAKEIVRLVHLQIAPPPGARADATMARQSGVKGSANGVRRRD
jgi:hypothetical protein